MWQNKMPKYEGRVQTGYYGLKQWVYSQLLVPIDL